MNWLTQNPVWLLIGAALALLIWRRFMARRNSESSNASHTKSRSTATLHATPSPATRSMSPTLSPRISKERPSSSNPKVRARHFNKTLRDSPTSTIATTAAVSRNRQ